MKYLEDTFKFLGKFIILALPLFISSFALQILSKPGNEILYKGFVFLLEKYQENTQMSNEEIWDIVKMYYEEASPFLTRTSMASIILGLLVIPATYGVINKALSTGHADLTDFLEEFRNNVGKYILYCVGTILLAIVVSAFVVMILMILGLLIGALGAIGIVISVLVGLALALALIGLLFMLVLWFPAMVVDKSGVFTALKKSISIVKPYYFPIVGIIILLGMGSFIASFFLGLFAGIPYIGDMIAVIPDVLREFIVIVFLFMIYRDRTGKNAANNVGEADLSGEYME